MSSEFLPAVNTAPSAEIQQLGEADRLLGEPIPDPDPEVRDDELPPAVDILSTQPINWSEAVEVEVVPLTVVDTTYAVAAALRESLLRYGVWDIRDEGSLQSAFWDPDWTGEKIGALILDWSHRLVVQLALPTELRDL